MLGGYLVGCQRLAPKPVEVSAKTGQSIGIDSIDALFAGRRVDHEPSVLEYFQVLRNRRPRDRQGKSQLANRARMLNQQFENRMPG